MTGGTLEIPSESLLRIDPEDTFTTVKIKLLDVPFADLIASSARAHGVAPELVASVIAVESNFNPNAVSWRSARGLMQLMPETAARFGVTRVFDPAQNIDAGTRYLKELLLRYNGDLALTLAAYNAGPERVEQYRSVPPYRETRDYVQRVTEKYRRLPAHPALKPSLNRKSLRYGIAQTHLLLRRCRYGGDPGFGSIQAEWQIADWNYWPDFGVRKCQPEDKI